MKHLFTMKYTDPMKYINTMKHIITMKSRTVAICAIALLFTLVGAKPLYAYKFHAGEKIYIDVRQDRYHYSHVG